MEDGSVLLHSEPKIPYPWLVFNEKLKVNSVFLRDSTDVSDSVVLLFGGNISRGGLDGHLKMLGGYLEFFMNPALANTYLSLKKELEDLIQMKEHVQYSRLLAGPAGVKLANYLSCICCQGCLLLDEVGFSADDLQDLVHSLSYVYQRSTTAISVVAPICYVHLVATQMGQFMKFENMSETSSSHGGLTSAGVVPVPQLPRLQDKVCNSMFFC